MPSFSSGSLVPTVLLEPPYTRAPGRDRCESSPVLRGYETRGHADSRKQLNTASFADITDTGIFTFPYIPHTHCSSHARHLEGSLSSDNPLVFEEARRAMEQEQVTAEPSGNLAQH